MADGNGTFKLATREEVVERIKKEHDLTGADLTGIDLAGVTKAAE